MGIAQRLEQRCMALQHNGLYRKRQLNSDSGVLINFSSNDYLSLTTEPLIQQAYQQGFSKYPVGSGGSMVVCGYHPTHKALELQVAELLGVDDCLLFSSGYAANLGVMGMLAHVDARVLIDKTVHASIYDGLRLSGGQYQRYRHHDLVDLTRHLNKSSEPNVLITESLFSMSGHVAPLAEMARLTQFCGGDLIVDEAHAFGVLGPHGLGGVASAGLTQDEVPLRVIPLGKACAASGALVAGQGAWIDALLQSARSHIYSTAMSPAFTHGLMETLAFVYRADDRRTKLVNLVHYFREKIKKSALQWRDAPAPIQQLQLGCPHLALLYADRLREKGIVCMPMRQPTVSKADTGLRVILNYHHEPEHIDYLFNCLSAL